MSERIQMICLLREYLGKSTGSSDGPFRINLMVSVSLPHHDEQPLPRAKLAVRMPACGGVSWTAFQSNEQDFMSYARNQDQTFPYQA